MYKNKFVLFKINGAMIFQNHSFVERDKGKQRVNKIVILLQKQKPYHVSPFCFQNTTVIESYQNKRVVKLLYEIRGNPN